MDEEPKPSRIIRIDQKHIRMVKHDGTWMPASLSGVSVFPPQPPASDDDGVQPDAIIEPEQ